MASYILNDTVDVRHDTARAWLPGIVTNAACASHGGHCWEVTLNAPVTANAWTGTTRRYGGTDNLKNNIVYISKNADLPGMTEGELIRTQV